MLSYEGHTSPTSLKLFLKNKNFPWNKLAVPYEALAKYGGADETRTRDLPRDRRTL